MSTAIAGARLSYVNQNLTKLRAFKLQVEMEIMMMNQFGFFVSDESVNSSNIDLKFAEIIFEESNIKKVKKKNWNFFNLHSGVPP